MSKKKNHEPETELFAPDGGVDLRITYPELQRISAFASLRREDMLFVWLAANRTSEIVKSHKGEGVRYAVAAGIAWEGESERIERYSEGEFPSDVAEALTRMAAFHVPFRRRAKDMIEKIMDTFEKMIESDDEGASNTPEDTDESGEAPAVVAAGIDWSKRKARVETLAKIRTELPHLIKMGEEGFGIKEKGSAGLKEEAIVEQVAMSGGK